MYKETQGDYKVKLREERWKVLKETDVLLQHLVSQAEVWLSLGWEKRETSLIFAAHQALCFLGLMTKPRAFREAEEERLLREYLKAGCEERLAANHLISESTGALPLRELGQPQQMFVLQHPPERDSMQV